MRGAQTAAQQAKRTGREPPRMATTNATATSYTEWAAALTEEQLAARLHMLAESLKHAPPEERAAILTESANRLGFPKSSNPKLGQAPKLKLGDAAATPEEAPKERAPRRHKTGDPKADRAA
jgi:hypothetical protein